MSPVVLILILLLLFGGGGGAFEPRRTHVETVYLLAYYKNRTLRKMGPIESALSCSCWRSLSDTVRISNVCFPS
jgi:hypothetical protein